jgi:tRNA (guanine9-N1)-methyltransferase
LKHFPKESLVYLTADSEN